MSEHQEQEAPRARPGEYDPRINAIEMTIWPQELAELDAIAERNGTTRDVILRLFLKRGLGENRE